MRKRILFIIACFWFIISFLLIGATYSKYLSSFNASTNVEIAVWNIVLNNHNIIRNSDFSNSLSLNFPGDTYSIANYIVPGGTGYFDLVIDTSSVTIPFMYSVTVAPNDDNEIDDIEVVAYSLDSGTTIIELDEDHTDISNSVMLNTVSSSIRVYVKWNDEDPQELDDDDDTNIALSEGSAVVDVTVTFEQISESNNP